jgi:hypothetical protein
MTDLTNWLFAVHAWAMALVSLFIANPQARQPASCAGAQGCPLCGRLCATGSRATPIGRRGCLGLCRPPRLRDRSL